MTVAEQGLVVRTVILCSLSKTRGPAPIARLLYEETAKSLTLRQAAAEQRLIAPEPCSTLHHGHPTIRDRREINKNDLAGWVGGWSATIDV